MIVLSVDLIACVLIRRSKFYGRCWSVTLSHHVSACACIAVLCIRCQTTSCGRVIFTYTNGVPETDTSRRIPHKLPKLELDLCCN